MWSIPGVGTVSKKELRRFVGSGRLKPTDVVYRGGDRFAAKDVPGLFSSSLLESSSYLRNGWVHLNNNDLDKAIDCYTMALFRDNNNCYARIFRGLALYDKAKLAGSKLGLIKALRDFEFIIKSNPRDKRMLRRAYRNREVILRKLGRVIVRKNFVLGVIKFVFTFINKVKGKFNYEFSRIFRKKGFRGNF